MADELALRRQCLADFRTLVAQYPTLGTTAAHARLNDCMCQQTISEGNDMPAKDYRTLGEDLINVAVRLPQSVIDQVDSHIATLRTMSPWARVGRSEVLRNLILRGIRSLDPQGEPAPVATAEDTPLVQHATSAHAGHVASPVPQAAVVQAADTPAPTMARQTPEASQDTPRASRRAQVLAAVPWEHVTPTGVSPANLRQGTGLSKAEVENDLRALHKRGDVVKVDKGHYIRRPQP